jgi:transcriptional regulator
MYVPKAFAEDNPDTLAALMRQASFATLLTSRDGVPLGSHIPLHLDQTGGHSGGQPGRLLGHLARANDHWRDFDGETEALAIFQGPHAYISPNWYETPNMVPTWNYAAVHAYGAPRVIEDAEQTLAILNQLVEANESDATGNWSMQKPDADVLRGMLKGIVAFEMPLSRLEGKWKMSQNRKPQDARGAAEGLRQAGGPEAEVVAAAMEARIEP